MTIELLSKAHNRKDFLCEEESLTKYIRSQVSQDIKRKLAACFVLTENDSVILGYYTLSTESIEREEVPEHHRKGLPSSYRAPVILLGRLARDVSQKGNKIGEFLLVDALLRCLRLSNESIGALAVVVDPINQYARQFYSRYGFIHLQDSRRMFIPMKTIEQLLEVLNKDHD